MKPLNIWLTMQFMVQDVPASVVEFLGIYAPHLASLQAGVQSIKVYVIPGLVLFGTIGNLLTIQMFKDVSLRSIPVVPYVRFLCMSDSLFLCALFLVWLRLFGFHILAIGGWCQAITFISQSCMFLSIWLTVLCAISTLVSCSKLLSSIKEHDTSWCMYSCWCYASTWKSTIIGIGFVILTIIIFFNISLEYGPLRAPKNNTLETDVMCVPMPNDMVAMKFLNKIDMIFNTVLPYVLLISVVVVILFQLRIQHRHGMMISSEPASLSTNNTSHLNNPPTFRLRQAEYDVIRAVIMNVILFLLCTLPSQCFYLYIMIPKFYSLGPDVTIGDDDVPRQLDPLMEIQTLLVSQLLMFLVVLRCTLAFVVYMLFSEFFRARILLYILPGRYKHSRVPGTTMPMSELQHSAA